VALKVKRKSAVKTTAKKSSKPLTTKEKRAIKRTPVCQAPKSPSCPAVSGENSPYMYQRGCRAEPCKVANRNYYKAWRDKKAKQEERQARKKARAKKAAKKR
jgi:hypothetical protein